MKVCKKCGKEIESGRVCTECKKLTGKASSKRYYEAHKDRVKASQKAYIQKLKDTGRYADLLEKHKVVAKRYNERKRAKRLIMSGELHKKIEGLKMKIAKQKEELLALEAYADKWYAEFGIDRNMSCMG